MPPLVVDVVTNHRGALLAREQAAMQEQARRWLQVEQAIQAQTDALTLELARDPIATTSQMMRSRRWQALAEQTRDELHKYERYMEPRITDGQRDMITRAIEHSAQAINAVATEAQIIVPFNRLPVASVEGMVGLAGDGSPLRDILADASSVGPDALAQELVNGIALGRNPIEVARQAIRRGLGQSFTRMQAISRTEQLRVYRITSLQSYQNSRVVVGYRRLSARDDRVCAACLMADGQQYPIDHGFDEHVQGRCTMIPVLRNVPPVNYETGQEWFARQTESTQLAILGRGRFDLWRRGEASLDDMVSRDWSDTWGGSLRVTNVGRLRNGGGRSWQSGGPAAPQSISYRSFVSEDETNEWAHREYKSWLDSLSKEEKHAFGVYRGSGYSRMNRYLRDGTGYIEDSDLKNMALMDKALDRSSVPDNILTYRGFYSKELLDDFDNLPGTILTEKGYVSTTLTRRVAEEEFATYGADSIIAEIRLPKGVRGGLISPDYSEEAEILLPHGSRFRVISAERRAGKHHLVLESIRE